MGGKQSFGDLVLADYGHSAVAAADLLELSIGTAYYRAPEINRYVLNNQRQARYGAAVDWWALGVLVVDVCLGREFLWRQYVARKPKPAEKLAKAAFDLAFIEAAIADAAGGALVSIEGELAVFNGLIAGLCQYDAADRWGGPRVAQELLRIARLLPGEETKRARVL